MTTCQGRTLQNLHIPYVGVKQWFVEEDEVEEQEK